jgi:hypothetical protein
VENVSPWPVGRLNAAFLISCRWARENFGGRPPAYFGCRESNPSVLKLCSTSRTRSGLVNVTFAIIGTSMPWGESSTICALRQVTTGPLDRRTMRNSLLPSSLSMARTCTRCTISHLLRGRQDQTQIRE